MARNPPPPRRMVHSVMSEMRDKIDLKLKGKKKSFKKSRKTLGLAFPFKLLKKEVGYILCVCVSGVMSFSFAFSVKELHDMEEKTSYTS